MDNLTEAFSTLKGKTSKMVTTNDYVKLQKANDYMFHVIKGHDGNKPTHLAGHKALKSLVTSTKGLERPDLLTCKKLRKMFSVAINFVGMNEAELEWFCQGLSH